jgi:hypothetical protein
MKEKDVWASLKSSNQLPFAVRIESPASPGVPDVYFALGNGVTGWMELKLVPDSHKKLLTLGTGAGQLRPLQVLWARQASEKNIFTTVLLFAEKRGILLSGQDVEVLLSATLDEVLAKALWVGSTSPRQRWIGLYEKLDKHGKETIQMATRSTRSLRD